MARTREYGLIFGPWSGGEKGLHGWMGGKGFGELGSRLSTIVGVLILCGGRDI